MTTDTDDVNNMDLRQIFQEIREDVEKAASREDLKELYKRAGYMITMTHASPVKDKSGGTMKIERGIAEQEFARTVHSINKRAKEIGVDVEYNESWEGLSTNDYEPEGENLLEAQAITENRLSKK
jgi:hypothetical protein